MVSMDKIIHFAQQIGDTFHPEKVLLFGSLTRDSETEDSDVDLLVVMNFTGKAKRVGKNVGKKSDWKKAIVSLKDGDSIEFFEGV